MTTLGLRPGVRRPVSKDTPDRTDTSGRNCPVSETRPKRPNRTNRTAIRPRVAHSNRGKTMTGEATNNEPEELHPC